MIYTLLCTTILIDYLKQHINDLYIAASYTKPLIKLKPLDYGFCELHLSHPCLDHKHKRTHPNQESALVEANKYYAKHICRHRQVTYLRDIVVGCESGSDRYGNPTHHDVDIHGEEYQCNNCQTIINNIELPKDSYIHRPIIVKEDNIPKYDPDASRSYRWQVRKK